MRAGGLRYKLELLQPVRVADRMGAETVTYTATRTVWAERVKATGNRTDEAGEHFPDYSVEFNIRSAHAVDENWRVRQLGGYLYTVTGVIPNLEKGYKVLRCERVNE